MQVEPTAEELRNIIQGPGDVEWRFVERFDYPDPMYTHIVLIQGMKWDASARKSCQVSS